MITSVSAFADPTPVKMKVVQFGFKPMPVPPISGAFWASKKKNPNTFGRGVLLVPSIGRSKADLDGIAKTLQNSGFNVLVLNPREKGSKSPRVLIEDIQTGVVFLKTDPRVKASHVAIFAKAESANAVAKYASTQQMMYVLDSIALFTNKDLSTEALKRIVGIPVLLLSNKADGSSEFIKSAKQVCPFCADKVIEKNADLNPALVGFFLNPGRKKGPKDSNG